MYLDVINFYFDVNLKEWNGQMNEDDIVYDSRNID